MTSSHYDYTSAVISKSQNGFQNGSWGNPYDYIVIGMQQWGTAKLNSTNSYPIAFSVIYNLNVGLSSRDTNDWAENPKNMTNTSFYLGDRGTYYVAFGK